MWRAGGTSGLRASRSTSRSSSASGAFCARVGPAPRASLHGDGADAPATRGRVRAGRRGAPRTEPSTNTCVAARGLESIGESADAIAKRSTPRPECGKARWGSRRWRTSRSPTGTSPAWAFVIPGPAANLLGGGAVLEAYRGAACIGRPCCSALARCRRDGQARARRARGRDVAAHPRAMRLRRGLPDRRARRQGHRRPAPGWTRNSLVSGGWKSGPWSRWADPAWQVRICQRLGIDGLAGIVRADEIALAAVGGQISTLSEACSAAQSEIKRSW